MLVGLIFVGQLFVDHLEDEWHDISVLVQLPTIEGIYIYMVDLQNFSDSYETTSPTCFFSFFSFAESILTTADKKEYFKIGQLAIKFRIHTQRNQLQDP